MTIKEALENHPAVLLFVVLVTGFGGGVGTVSYLEAREEKLRENIIEELRSKNQALSRKNEALYVEYQETLAMAESANAEIQTLTSTSLNVDTVIGNLRSENQALSQQNEALNVEYQETLAMVESANAEVKNLNTTYQYVSTDIELIGKAMSSLLKAYVWIERNESPDRVIPELDNAIDALKKSETVTSITSLASARSLYQRVPKGEVQRKLDDAIGQIEEQISR